MPTKKIWRLPEVLNQTGLSRSTIYDMIRHDEFPREINLGPRAVGWAADDVLAWINLQDRRFSLRQNKVSSTDTKITLKAK